MATSLMRRGGIDIDVESPEGGPAAAAVQAAALKLVRGGGTQQPDLDAIERGVLSQGVRKARLFNLSKPEDAEAWAELMQRSEALGTAQVLRIRELINGVEYAHFIEWMEYNASVEAIRESEEEKRVKVLERLSEDKAAEAPVEPKKRTRKAAPVVMPDPPATHQGLEAPK